MRALALVTSLATVVLVTMAHPLPATAATVAVRPLPVATPFDYQLGGARDLPDGVGIVVRDRQAPPVLGTYSVCYVNGFQTQPNERAFWRRRKALVLHHHGRPVLDTTWGEWLMDLRTAARRRTLARIVRPWTRRCAAAGFDAIEFDNLDSYRRSLGLLRRRHAIAFARVLVRDAHRAGLAAAQKNAPDIDGPALGFDFAIAEECARYDECQRYVARYGRRVLDIEYRAADLDDACRTFVDRLSIVLRDRALRPTGTRRWCTPPNPTAPRARRARPESQTGLGLRRRFTSRTARCARLAAPSGASPPSTAASTTTGSRASTSIAGSATRTSRSTPQATRTAVASGPSRPRSAASRVQRDRKWPRESLRRYRLVVSCLRPVPACPPTLLPRSPPCSTSPSTRRRAATAS
jgi:hypothetical protein